MAWLNENWGLLLAVLLGVSEALALIPFIQSNSIFQLIVNVLKTVAPKKELPPK